MAKKPGLPVTPPSGVRPPKVGTPEYDAAKKAVAKRQRIRNPFPRLPYNTNPKLTVSKRGKAWELRKNK